MKDKLIVTFDKSQEDIPVLVIGRENLFTFAGSSMLIIATFTGDKAVDIYNTLTCKTEAKIVE